MKRLFEILGGRLTRGKKALAAASMLMLLLLTVPSLAYYLPLNSTSSGNIGVGTASPKQDFLLSAVMSG